MYTHFEIISKHVYLFSKTCLCRIFDVLYRELEFLRGGFVINYEPIFIKSDLIHGIVARDGFRRSKVLSEITVKWDLL